MRIVVVLLLSCIVFASCRNCTSRVHGFITDDNANLAIDSVKIRSFGALSGSERDERIVYTDTNGYYETYFSSSGTAKCPVLKLEITRDGYYPIVTADAMPGDTIFMKKIVP